MTHCVHDPSLIHFQLKQQSLWLLQKHVNWPKINLSPFILTADTCLELHMILGSCGDAESFLTSPGKPVAHYHLVSDLLDAILLSKQIAVCKCETHTNSSDPVSLGNARTDAVAKAAAKKQITNSCFMQQPETHTDTPYADISELQRRATAAEKIIWRSDKCTFTDGTWYGPNGKPCLPKCLLPFYVKLSHGKDQCFKMGDDEGN